MPKAEPALYVVYLTMEGLIEFMFDPRPRKAEVPQRDANLCPNHAYGFFYATTPAGKKIERFSDLSAVSSVYYVDAVLIPTARLKGYVESTGAYSDVRELLRNGDGALFHVHTPCGRFFAIDHENNQVLSTARAKGDSMDRSTGEVVAARPIRA